MLKNIFRLTILLQFLAIALVVITPVISVNKLLYPTRIDSAFVNMQQLQFQKMKEATQSDTSAIFLYSPSQLQINFTELEFPMPDSIKLRGWMAIDTTKMISPLLLIIPDMLEGAIDYIPAMQEFSARGLRCTASARNCGRFQPRVGNVPGQLAGSLSRNGPRQGRRDSRTERAAQPGWEIEEGVRSC